MVRRIKVDLITAFGAASVVFLATSDISSFGAELTLRQKLATQFERYALASRILAQKVGRDHQVVSRMQWEQILSVPPKAQLSSSDVAALRAEQGSAVAAARTRALAAPGAINLAVVRKKRRAAELCRQVPKGGMLHVHGWGTVDRATAEMIVSGGDPLVDLEAIREDTVGHPTKEYMLYPSDFEFGVSGAPGGSGARRFSQLADLEKKGVLDWLFMEPGKYDPHDPDIFRRFMGSFTAMGTLFFRGKGNPEPLMWEALLKRANSQGLFYLEVTQNLNGATPEKMSAKEREFEQVAAQALERYGITLKIIAQFDRGDSSEINRTKVEQTLAANPSTTVVGLNLVANEERYPALESGQTVYGQLLAAREDGRTTLHATIHAGELGDPRNLRDAMIFGAERVGHGVKFDQDPVALEYARGDASLSRSPIAVEANLQSNLRLGAIDDVRKHPFLRQLRLGIPVSLSTDDEGILVTDANLECQTAIESTDITWNELKLMFANSISTSFATKAEKTALAVRLATQLDRFEKTWK